MSKDRHFVVRYLGMPEHPDHWSWLVVTVPRGDRTSVEFTVNVDTTIWPADVDRGWVIDSRKHDPDEKEQILSGFIKWDGCSHLYFGDKEPDGGANSYWHACGAEGYRTVVAAMAAARRIAISIMDEGPDRYRDKGLDGGDWEDCGITFHVEEYTGPADPNSSLPFGFAGSVPWPF